MTHSWSNFFASFFSFGFCFFVLLCFVFSLTYFKVMWRNKVALLIQFWLMVYLALRSPRQSSSTYPARQRFLALSSRWETRGTSARNRTISYRACANYVSICHAKRHFLSLKVNVTSSYFAGTAYDNFGAKTTTLRRQLLFLRRMCRLKLPQKPIDWVFPNAVWFVT